MTLIGLVTACMSFAACQSRTYKVTGKCAELQDGDVLYVTSDFNSGVPSDSTTVKDGRFELSGTTDSTRFCMIYAKKKNAINIPFFIEPGNITLTLSGEPEKNKVYGTDTNNKWQQMNDSTTRIGKQINLIATYIYNNKLEGAEQAAEMAKIDKLQKQYNQYVTELAEKNIDNEFGYFLVTFNTPDTFTPTRHLTLLKKLPEDKRNTAKVIALEEQLKNLMKLEVGNTVETFTINDINGKSIDLLTEVAKHKMTILDFWASWCGPCRQEMPNVVSIYANNKDKGLGIIGISLDNKEDAWKQAVKTLGMTWTQVSDLKGWKSDAAAQFGVRAIPQTFILDNKGKILAKGLRGEELKTFIEKGL